MQVPTKRVHFLRYPLDALTMDETVAEVRRMIQSKEPHVHICLNAGKVVAMEDDQGLAQAVLNADLVSADGQSVVWASRLLGKQVPVRVAGIDLMSRLLREAEASGLGVYLLGSTNEVLARLLNRLSDTHPGLKIAGHHNGYFSRAEESAVIDEVRSSHADILFVALSTPKKELWLDEHHDSLRIPFCMGVGGSFEVLAGIRTRAPQWACDLGLEWLFRFFQEPRRMWRRYLIGNLRFAGIVVGAILKRAPVAKP